MSADLKIHWENVYATKQPNEVSWTQDVPATSIAFFEFFNLPLDAAIIDIGGGDSKLVDYLLGRGYTNVSVLDISAKAIERAKARLGTAAEKVNWIVSDINDFAPTQVYDFWHDRAAFHFLTHKEQINRYADVACAHAKAMVIGTFSVNGPLKCSGLEITQYDEITMKALFEARGMKNIECLRVDHTTPFNTVQNFVFCSFAKVA